MNTTIPANCAKIAPKKTTESAKTAAAAAFAETGSRAIFAPTATLAPKNTTDAARTRITAIFAGSGFVKTVISVTTKATYTSDYTISKEYAKQLIEQGYLAEVAPKEEKPFVNVFDEIDALIAKYTEDLNDLSNTKGEIPDVIKLENKTVLLNLIKVLNHLASLKK